MILGPPLDFSENGRYFSPDDVVRGGSAASMVDTRRPEEADVLETRTVATRVTAVVCADGARP